MTKFPPLERADSIAKAINPQYLAEEQPLVRSLADQARLSETAARNAGARALALVQAVRAATRQWRRARRLPARVQPGVARGRDPHVPRRGAAAHSRWRDRGPAHRRQDSERCVGRSPGRLRIDAGECLHLGIDAHRPRRVAGPQRSGRGAVLVCATGGQARRARGARRAQAGDAHPRPPVRHGARHRKRVVARRRQGRARLSLLLRHAGRGRAHARGCRAISREICGGDCGRRARRSRRASRSPRATASPSSCRRCIRATSSRRPRA